MPSARARALANPHAAVLVHELAGLRNVAREAGFLGVEEVDLLQADAAQRLDHDAVDSDVALRERLGRRVRVAEIRTRVAPILIRDLQPLAPSRRVHRDCVDDAAELLEHDVAGELSRVHRHRADRGTNVALERRNLRAQDAEVVVAVGAVVDERGQTPIRSFEARIENVRHRRVGRHDHVVVLGHGRVSRQRNVAAVRVDRGNLLDVRVAELARRRVDEREEHADVDETVTEVVARDVARSVQLDHRARRARVDQGEHAAAVHTERVVLTARDVVDQTGLFVRHAVTEGSLARNEILHRFLGHADAAHDLLDLDPTLRGVLVAGDRVGRILVREERGVVTPVVMVPHVTSTAIVVGGLGLEPFLQVERVVHALGDRLFVDVFFEAGKGNGICAHVCLSLSTE